MKFDLQDWWRANPKLFIAGAAVIVAAFVALVVSGVTSSNSSSKHAVKQASATSTATTAAPDESSTTQQSGVTTPSASYRPSYTHVPATPADQKMAAAEEGSGAVMARVEGIVPPAPAWTTAYPSIPKSQWHSEQGYATAFAVELLDRNYASQTRNELGMWLSAESAGDLIPGVPAAAGSHQLYAEAMDPKLAGVDGSPVPSAAEWTARAKADEKQHVYGVFVNPNGSWANDVAHGITSDDPLLDVLDVTGVLTTRIGGQRPTTKHFSMQLYVASALHHPGYGSFGFDEWAVR